MIPGFLCTVPVLKDSCVVLNDSYVVLNDSYVVLNLQTINAEAEKQENNFFPSK